MEAMGWERMRIFKNARNIIKVPDFDNVPRALENPKRKK
jgi:hypothetical protein